MYRLIQIFGRINLINSLVVGKYFFLVSDLVVDIWARRAYFLVAGRERISKRSEKLLFNNHSVFWS